MEIQELLANSVNFFAFLFRPFKIWYTIRILEFPFTTNVRLFRMWDSRAFLSKFIALDISLVGRKNGNRGLMHGFAPLVYVSEKKVGKSEEFGEVKMRIAS